MSRTKSLEHSVIVRNESETISPSLLNPPGFPPPPPPPPPKKSSPPPPLPKKSPNIKTPEDLSATVSKPGVSTPSPIIRPISKGLIVEISCGNGLLITGKVKECQVKKTSKDYQKFKNHWNVEILKGNDEYRKGQSYGFDLKNPESYKIVTAQPSQQHLAVGSKDVKTN